MTSPKTPAPVKPPTKPVVEPMRMHSFYCDDPTWDNAMAKAKADGFDLSEVLRHYLREYGGTKL